MNAFPGGVSQQDDDSDAEESAACPFSPGDTVSGVVSANQNVDGAVAMDLHTTAPKSPKSKNKKKQAATVSAVLPHMHLGDHASVCGETLAAAMTPGTKVEQLLVLEADRKGVPTVTLKPLLLSAAGAASGTKSSGAERNGVEAFIPKSAGDVSVGDLVVGFVSKVEAFGVFVKFLGRFAALCPRSMAADRLVEDPRGMFTEGDSVRWALACAVQVFGKNHMFAVGVGLSSAEGLERSLRRCVRGMLDERTFEATFSTPGSYACSLLGGMFLCSFLRVLYLVFSRRSVGTHKPQPTR